MTTVWIIQQYVPRYRVALFERLIASLATHDVTLRIAAGVAEGAQADRGDAVSADWLEPTTWRRLGPAQLTHARPLYRGAAAVIFPHLGSNPELSAQLLRRSLGGRTRVGVWGHIRNYVSAPNRLDAAVERWQLRRADRVFAYTRGGAEYARGVGVPAEKIVTLNNTIDTDELAAAVTALDAGEVERFQAQHGLVPDRTIAYIGGLDDSKRIDFLVGVLDLLWESAPDVKLLVGGLGRLAGLLDRAVQRGQAIRLGYADTRTKALMAASSRLLVNPGRVGLLAVEALVLGLPLVTTRWPYHAPEIEYLVEGRTLFTSADDVRSYADLVVHLLSAGSPAGPGVADEAPSLAAMVDRFSTGIIEMLERSR